MSEINKSKFALAVTGFALITSIIGAFSIIYESHSVEPYFGFFIFYLVMGILDLGILYKFKLIKKIDGLSVSIIISYFLLTFGFILNTRQHIANVFFSVILLSLMNITLTTEVIREHMLIRSTVGFAYYVGGKFIAFFDYIGDFIGSVKFTNRISKDGATDVIKTVLIFGIVGVPAILVILGLLSASNAKFAEEISKIFDWNLDFGINFARVIFIGIVSIYLVTDLYFLKALKKYEESISKEIKLSLNNIKNALRAGVLTVTIINIFYIFFIFIDLGQDVTNARNLLLSKGVNTYSEFAVTRFWELITVSIINLIIFYFFTGFYKKLNAGNSKILRPYISINLIILFINSLGLIFSVHQRLSLYESGYGLTDNRLLAHIFIFILAGIFIISLAGLYLRAHTKLQLASVSIVLMFLCLYNALPIDYITNKANYELAKSGKIERFDPTYTLGLYGCNYFFEDLPTQSQDGQFVAIEILQENKVSLGFEDKKCMEDALKTQKDKKLEDLREFNISSYLLQQKLNSTNF